ncbi:hypothetical protein Pmani_039478 [Petrolisthes manimaculis]|uniref:Uncharacterized protein n=1 Tax=Petrolisthes manimaculis TaxID=1843537 RepID=A0AAE1TJI4_9EUCA|nr:hypothetical protein Pmani_039478 [Petrolisthes manimaculis]
MIFAVMYMEFLHPVGIIAHPCSHHSKFQVSSRLVKHHNLECLCDYDCIAVILKPEWLNFAVFWYGHPGYAFD